MAIKVRYNIDYTQYHLIWHLYIYKYIHIIGTIGGDNNLKGYRTYDQSKVAFLPRCYLSRYFVKFKLLMH